LIWTPTTVERIQQLYPQKNAISDINSFISAANQQPGVSFPLVGPGDNRGGLFIKTDESGNFYVARNDKNPKVFTNPGLNSDGDNDWDDKGKAMVPTTSSFDKVQINVGDLRHIVASLGEELKALRNEVKELKEHQEVPSNPIKTVYDDPLSLENLLTEKKISVRDQMEGMDDKSRSVIQKLLNAADDIRSGKSTLADSAYLQSGPKTTTDTIRMGGNTPSAVLTETVQTEIPSVEELHEMLVKTTKKNKNKDSVLENVANNLSTLIAEALLTNEIKSGALLEETLVAYDKLVR
jgi:hypothetical protein